MVRDMNAVAAHARAARRRSKHLRWIEELAGDGWTSVQASHITVGATYAEDPSVYAHCQRCDSEVFADFLESEVPLPRVLHAVSGHTCQGSP